jgi:L-iditol 2-dehydrogenase
VLNILQKQAARYPFASLISHRMGLDELAAKMEVVTDPNECVKVEVVPHASLSNAS